MFSAAWHDIRAVVCVAPNLYAATKAERLFEALPLLVEPAAPGEDFHQTIVVEPSSGPSAFTNAFAAKLSLPRTKLIGDLLMSSLLSKPSFRFGRQSTGTCSCGRRALVLARCIHCAKAGREDEQEIADSVEELLDSGIPGNFSLGMG